MVEWTLTRDETETEDNLYDIQYVDSANTFGDYLIAKIDDINGTKFDEYPRGTRVDASVTPTDSTTAIDKFSGYVVERREVDQGGADALEIEAYTFDQFLRNNTVSTDLSGQTIDTALQTIVENDTPVTFNASKVTVGDNQELTRSFRGVKVEEALIDLAFKSESEDFGVDANLDFFFKPEETEHIDRGVDDTNWFNYDIPERGKEAINEVEVWYDGGDESVIVDNGQDKLDLQESLGLNTPGTQRAEITREEITNLSDAEDEGRKYLQLRNSTLTGEITTFALYTAEPGDTIDVSISTRGINTEFRIAEVDYRWADDQTLLTIVEKRGNNDDILLRLTDAVSRVEMREANRDAPKNRITTTEAIAFVKTSTTYNSATSVTQDRFVNDGRDYIRNVWSGSTINPIDTLVFGSDNTGISRSNSDLKSQTNSVTVTVTTSGSDVVEFTASGLSITASEFGLKTNSGRLIYRAVLDSSVTITDVSIIFTISDDSVSRSVLTNAGQEAVRDILADNNPVLPQEYAYGSGTTIPIEGDTGLEIEEVRQDLDDVQIEEYDTTTDFENAFGAIDETTPLIIENGDIRQAQTSFTQTADDMIALGTYTAISFSNSDPSYESSTYLLFDTVGQYAEYEITLNHTVPTEFETNTLEPQMRGVVSGAAGAIFATFAFIVDGEKIGEIEMNDDLEWHNMGVTDIDQEYPAGTYTVRFELISISETDVEAEVDVFSVVDDRFNYTFDNTLDSNNHLSGPELFPSLQEIASPEIPTSREVGSARVDSTWNDVSNNQFIELSNDGSNFIRTNNSSTANANFSSDEVGVFVQFGISRYGSNTNDTPTSGDATQELSLASIFANPESVNPDDIGVTLTRAVLFTSGIVGTLITESGLFATDGSLLTRHVFAEFEALSNQRIISAEVTRFTGEDS